MAKVFYVMEMSLPKEFAPDNKNRPFSEIRKTGGKGKVNMNSNAEPNADSIAHVAETVKEGHDEQTAWKERGVK